MPSIRSRDIACVEGPDIWALVHFLKLLDVVNNAFQVHWEQYSEPASPPNRIASLNCQRQQNIFILGKTLEKEL